ncbi:cytochrome oxidase subunit I [Mucilaginibacter pallidiroseus]|uniref:Cytochrome oxidase subunit I n=2 Tax=Mucilaginibacter pallidiroseus TaxID=2599295 RepID=A0A563TYT2_9SPHI|nr:cytochrome oxidase subunit I [Mucilaginibacter pallidiroseus]
MISTSAAFAVTDGNSGNSGHEISKVVSGLAMGSGIFIMLLLLLWLYRLSVKLRVEAKDRKSDQKRWRQQQLSALNRKDLSHVLTHKAALRKRTGNNAGIVMAIIFMSLLTAPVKAETEPVPELLVKSPGMIITVTLILLPLMIAVWYTGIKISRLIRRIQFRRIENETADLLTTADADPEFYQQLLERKASLDFKLSDEELGSTVFPADQKGLLHNIAEVDSPRFLAAKRKASVPHDLDKALVKVVLWYLVSATAWLVLGTSVGEYLGIKFVAPDADHVSWLSFGRLRPVHTNMVFWGWSSLAMLGLGYYVVPRVSNTVVFSIRLAYWSLILVNSAVLGGSLTLMAGINNGGGEYREYIWPVMALFGGGIFVTLYNYYRTIGKRTTTEIYISNWYIVAAMMFVIVIVLVGYIPQWQNGLGETIVQGYYMHQAVGMWFMLFNLGLIYYFLPQQLNTPIYSYSLGILAFWAQILFYTLIGTHHFLFSSIPWWLQTVAIVGSVGMLIPVFAGTTNFLMTMKGNFHKISRSYTLPFYLVGIIFYFTGSMQGTAEAFRETNLVWHFTDFTTAHSHITMYGIIAFMLWAFIYTLVPRLTGKEPGQHWVGAHFWLALVGLLFYTVPLMIGGTLKGMAWQSGKPFIDSVVLMAPYWLWRAIGGSLMWLSHLVFCWNMYTMTLRRSEDEIRKEVMDALGDHHIISNPV